MHAGFSRACRGARLARAQRWTCCASTDRTAPCGAIEPTVADSAIRSNYLYYNDGNARGGADTKTLNFSLTPVATVANGSVGQLLTKMDNFPVDYEVNALLCLIDTVTPGNQCLTQSEFNSTYGTGTVPTVGGANSAGYGENNFSSSGLYAITLVSRSRLVSAATAVDADTENAQVVLKATTATFRIIGHAPDVPLIASGSVTGLGNAEIVTNPNGGGTGIPLSVWTYGCIHVTKADTCGGNSDASFSTCYSDEFFQTGGANTGPCSAPSTGAACQYDGSTTCGSGGSACSCSKIANMVGNSKTPYGLGALSGHYGGNTVAGPDLLGKSVGGILPDVQYFPLSPLNVPPDQLNNSLFEYAFGAHVADSSEPFCWSRRPTPPPTPPRNSRLIISTTLPIPAAAGVLLRRFRFQVHAQGCGLHIRQRANRYAADAGNAGRAGRLFVFLTDDIFWSYLRAVDRGNRRQSGHFGGLRRQGDRRTTALWRDDHRGLARYRRDTAAHLRQEYAEQFVNGPGNTRMGILPGSWSDAGRIDVATGTYSEN